MSKSLTRLRENGSYCSISQQYNRPYETTFFMDGVLTKFQFTLQKGHLFGWDADKLQPFVVQKILKNHIVLYVPDNRKWDDTCSIRKITMPKNTDLGRIILEKAAERKRLGFRGVTYEPVKKQVQKIYNPPLTANYNYQRTNYMRIPGGAEPEYAHI